MPGEAWREGPVQGNGRSRKEAEVGAGELEGGGTG